MSAIDDFKDDYKHEMQHVEELGVNELRPVGTTSDVEYPQALRDMEEAPSLDTLRAGLSLQQADMHMPLGQAFSRDWRMFACTLPFLIAAMGTGIDGGLSGISVSMPKFLFKFGEFNPVTKGFFLPSLWKGLWDSMVALGVAIGAMSSGYLLDRWGPQKIVIIASVLFICPVMIQTFAQSRVMMLVGKLLGGIPQGIFNVAASNFVSEASNLRMRGPLSALLPLSAIGGVALGLTIGYERIAYVTSDWLSWRLALLMQIVPPIICIATLPFATTSPIFLVKKGRMEDARKSLGKLYGTTADIPARLAIIQQAVAIEREEAAKIGASSYKDLFSTAIARKRTFASAWLWFTFQANGQVFIASGLYFLIITGMDITTAFTISVCFLSLSALVNIGSGSVINKIGRRNAFLYGNLIYMAVMAILGGLHFAKGASGQLAVAVMINIAIAAQQLGGGAPTYTLLNEISSLRLRAKTQSIAIAFNFVLNWAWNLVTPYIYQPGPGNANLGAASAFIFVGTTGLCLVVAFFVIPETNGRTVIQMDLLYESKVPIRKFGSTDIAALERLHAREHNVSV
ncbi:hypothetical protein QFC21_004188 [Naganishia friedmannii]|uniref:Uncharacterized protein n=1 Tax=Naganishia friedmannii TaxID=89922 RepID=A0ACC2VJ49_9TREE|nr:hypothetical protein QFC21_004188 [Naganishia friedmannii]